MIKRERLDRDQRLIVIHCQNGVVSCPCGGMEKGIGGQWPARVYVLSPELFDCRLHNLAILVPECAVLSRMRIDTSYGEARARGVKTLLQLLRGKAARLFK